MLACGSAAALEEFFGVKSPISSFGNVPSFATVQVKGVCAGDNYFLILNEDAKLHFSGAKTDDEKLEYLGGVKFVDVGGGSCHCFAVTYTGQLYGWGSNDKGQLGLTCAESTCSVDLPREVEYFKSKRVVQVACGNEHSMILTCDGAVYATGDNRYGQLGLGDTSINEGPALVSTLHDLPLAQISAGGWHSFCVTLSGAAFSWGRNDYGQLGLGDQQDRYLPTHLKHPCPLAYIAAGDHHSAVLTKNGEIFTFGSSQNGQLGNGMATQFETRPMKVDELKGSIVSQVACGRNHTIVYVPGSRNVFVWGYGAAGQLGLGEISSRSEPTIVKGPWRDFVNCGEKQEMNVRFVSAGGNSSVVILGTGDEPSRDFRHIIEHRRIWTMNNDICDKISQIDEESSVPAEVAERLRCVLSSPSCIIASFIHADCTASEESHAVDLRKARSTFSCIISRNNKELLDAVTLSVNDVLRRGIGTNILNLEALQLFLVLPELFLQQENRSLFAEFAKQRLAPQYSEILSHWSRLLVPEDFMTAVRLCKDYVVANARLDVKATETSRIDIDDDLMQVLEFFKELDRINRSGDNLIVPFKKFYIPELSIFDHILIHYVNWDCRVPSFCGFPFMLDSKAKSFLLEIDGKVQMGRQDTNSFMNIFRLFSGIPLRNIIKVNRKSLIEDSLMQLRQLGNLKKPFIVVFDGEEGEDYGGLRKEYFMLVLEELLDPKLGLFYEDEESHFLWFSNEPLDDLYWLVGTICGLAVFNNAIININFPLALYKKLLGQKVTFSDFLEFDPVLGYNLRQLLEFVEEDGDTVEDVFCLSFTAPGRSPDGSVAELVTNGADVAVTSDNREQYVEARVDYLFNKSVERQFARFRDGFMQVCGGKVLDLFKPIELMEVVAGNEDYDWKELERSAIYKGYGSNEEIIVWFWEVLHAMTVDEKKEFLIFLTGSKKIPLAGLKILIIKQEEQHLLPVAHTCFNPPHFFLPCYSGKEVVKEKMLLAIKCKGFHTR